MSEERALAQFGRTGDSRDARRVHEVVRSGPDFRADTPWFWQAERLLLQDRWDEAIRLLRDWLPSASMSPDAHVMLAYAYGEIGECALQAEQAALAETALALIKATGSGTRERPWQVLRVIDEYALLADQGLSAAGQRLWLDSGTMYDVIALRDGTERWFQGGWCDGVR